MGCGCSGAAEQPPAQAEDLTALEARNAELRELRRLNAEQEAFEKARRLEPATA